MPASVPNLHISTKGKVTGSATVFINRRQDIAHAGEFRVKAAVSFDPASDAFPSGTIRIAADLSDSLKATFTSTSVELINSFGKHTPTIIFTGRCRVALQEDSKEPIGCKYWVMIADNARDNKEETPDIVGFVIIDRTGNRVAYGTGPVREGDLVVEPN